MIHIEACRVAESRGTQSWDLRSFDSAGLLLSLDHFHFQGSFSEAGMAAVEFLAITSDVVLIGSWRGSMRRDIWHIEAHAAEAFPEPEARLQKRRTGFSGHD